MENLVRISDAASLGMHAMGILAVSSDQAVSVRLIAKALDVSAAHLSKVLQRLQRARLVSSKRGPSGGFILTVAPDATTLLQVYEAIDGPLPSSTCLLNHHECPGGHCVMGNVLHEVYAQVHEHLRSTTLSDLAATPSFRRFQPLGAEG